MKIKQKAGKVHFGLGGLLPDFKWAVDASMKRNVQWSKCTSNKWAKQTTQLNKKHTVQKCAMGH